jgi:CheY-like chemotaxis protein
MARVLVVDDNHDACELLARILRRTGHEAVCQTTARSALAYLGSSTPDLVILDVMMPEMTGLDLLKAIRANPRTANVNVVVFTALSDEKTRGEAARLGATGYVVKGSEWMLLQAEIQKYVGPRPDAGGGVSVTSPSES